MRSALDCFHLKNALCIWVCGRVHRADKRWKFQLLSGKNFESGDRFLNDCMPTTASLEAQNTENL